MPATKIGENLKTAVFHYKFTLYHIKNQISTYRKLKLSLTSSIYLVLLPLEMLKKTRTDQSISCVFLLCLKRIDPQIFKSSSCKNTFLQCVCYCYNMLPWMLLFYMITGRHCFSWKFVDTQRFFKAPCCCLLWSQCFERSPYFMRYLHNNNTKVSK